MKRYMLPISMLIVFVTMLVDWVIIWRGTENCKYLIRKDQYFVQIVKDGDEMILKSTNSGECKEKILKITEKQSSERNYFLVCIILRNMV